MTYDTVFEAASMTKPVCAYIVLRLVDRGVLKLDTPLYTYLPYEDIAYDDRYKLITARMVLTHRTGFPNWRSGKLDIKFTPGTQFNYSGEGFVYLGKVVEKLTGKKLVQLCQEEVFEPLEIEHASLVWTEEIAKLTATGHGGTSPMAKGRPSQPNMAASLHVDAKNYAKFLIAYVQGKGLAAATAKDMLRSQGAIPDDPNSSFGLGVGIGQTPQGTHFGHGGRNTGFTSLSVMYKDLGIGYVFLVNNDDASKVENILNAYLITGKSGLKSTKPIAHKLAKIDPKIYEEYVGGYQINYETIVTVTREGDKLMAQPSGDARFELFPESETVFFLKPTTDATATFVKDANGKFNRRPDAEQPKNRGEAARRRTGAERGRERDAGDELSLRHHLHLGHAALRGLQRSRCRRNRQFFHRGRRVLPRPGGLTRSREAAVQTFRKKFGEKDSRLRRELVEGNESTPLRLRAHRDGKASIHSDGRRSE